MCDSIDFVCISCTETTVLLSCSFASDAKRAPFLWQVSNHNPRNFDQKNSNTHTTWAVQQVLFRCPGWCSCSPKCYVLSFSPNLLALVFEMPKVSCFFCTSHVIASLCLCFDSAHMSIVRETISIWLCRHQLCRVFSIRNAHAAETTAPSHMHFCSICWLLLPQLPSLQSVRWRKQCFSIGVLNWRIKNDGDRSLHWILFELIQISACIDSTNWYAFPSNELWLGSGEGESVVGRSKMCLCYIRSLRLLFKYTSL